VSLHLMSDKSALVVGVSTRIISMIPLERPFTRAMDRNAVLTKSVSV